MLKQKMSKVLCRYGLQSRIWWFLWQLHWDATRNLNESNPSAAMLKSREFFENNTERISAVLKLFADSLSREIFKKQVEYRQTYNRKLASPYNMKDQYFPKDIVHLGEDDVFVDCGAYVGDITKRFIKLTKGRYKRIICFEPDQNNAEALCRLGKTKRNIVIYKKGTWSCSQVLYLKGNGISNAKLSDEDIDAQKIVVVALDDVPECQDITFLKMDIEGAEWETLQGATKIIERNRPILAICIYHSDEDMLRIPEMIKSKWPEYKLYVRQHFFLPLETVLYAIPIDRI